jgi:hypothetical protein
MDLYPEVAIDLKLFHDSSWTTRIVAKVAHYTRRKGDGIMVLGKCMRQRLIAAGISSEKIFVAENWADGHLIQPMPLPASDSFIVLYSGNLGLAHDIETISAAMDKHEFHPPYDLVTLLIGVILIVGALTFFPALALGPIVEHLQMGL